MATYPATIAALTRHIQAQEAALPLRSEQSRSRFWLQPQPTAKVCLFFHGFTAAPYQFEPMATALYRSGYNVLVPRLPGHGQAGTWNHQQPPPLPTDPALYQRFAIAWLQQAQALGQQVIVGGLSGGGTIAAWLAFEQPDAIYRTILFAPYLTSSRKVIDLFVRWSDGYFEWVGGAAEQPDNPGYGGFSLPSLRTFLSLGSEVLRQAKSQRAAPIFTISSESDRAVGNRDHEALFNRALPRQPRCWYQRFDRILDIPHTMMTQAEGNSYEFLLIALTKAFIESDLTWAEVEEIGFRMAQGRLFRDVVATLKLSDRASVDMPTMMTMVDKRSIVMKRNPASRRDR